MAKPAVQTPASFKKKKHPKPKKGTKFTKKTQQHLPVPSWSKVKIAGNLVTDDGGGLEGLIGLEVLENYDPKVIATSGKVISFWLQILIGLKYLLMAWCVENIFARRHR